MQTHSSSCFSDMAGQAKPSEQSAERSGTTGEDAEHKKEAVKKSNLKASSNWTEHMAKFTSDFLTYSELLHVVQTQYSQDSKYLETPLTDC